MKTSLYSVRMRASARGQHLAGAERIVSRDTVDETTKNLTARAMGAPNGPPDEVHCSVELIDPATILYAKLPDISTLQVTDWQQGHQAAIARLISAGVARSVAVQALAVLAGGAGPGGVVMRGAVIMDVKTGERLEADSSRGVRVSRMDLSCDCRHELEPLLFSAGLGHYRVLEAVVLSGKVLQAPGIVAELCWSDAPDYTTGYVSDRKNGYQRISAMKLTGDCRGGRVFFVDRTLVTVDEVTDFLEHQPVLFNAFGTISAARKWGVADG